MLIFGSFYPPFVSISRLFFTYSLQIHVSNMYIICIKIQMFEIDIHFH